jgi:hypothetical protein
MARRIGQGIRECPRDFLRIDVREQPAKSLEDLQGGRNRLLG